MSSFIDDKKLMDYLRDEVVTIGDPLLREPTKQITNLKEAEELCNLMVEKVRELKGAGLAANQIGVPARIFVAELRKNELFPNRPESPLYIMINPEIISTSKEMIEGWEGCFSVPNMVGLVPRHESITVKYLTLDGIEHQETFSTHLARTIQHEVDHLDGIIYFERMKDLSKLMTKNHFVQSMTQKS
ncbi:MAG: peptide deformylase [Blastocatellia bacterium]|nr:peptide deformylase [Blastocatellia bacterium]MBN8724707.1 peptide deformylase [Acidobacteriota bacterium]